MFLRLTTFLLLAAAAVCRAAAEGPASFRNDVMAVLSKAGCNSGACHGNASGKAAFKLSLRGESPELDYLALTHDQLSRRVNTFEPAESLILLKPTTGIPHEGGQRFATNSWEYEALYTWIAQGPTNDFGTASRVETLEVSPLEAYVIEPQTEIQLTAKATFSDGTTRDVTAIAVYESANPIVNITPGGLVQSQQPGETTILVRYLEKQVPVRLAFIPARPDFAWSKPVPHNYIDRLNFAKLQRLRVNPSELCSDEAFVRRSYLDLLGLPPTAAEARSFVFDPSPEKRRRLIDELLQRPEFADFWALKWSDILRNEERILDRKGMELFHRWVRQSILDHKPLDRFVREIIAARGSTYKNPAANFYRATRTPVERGEAAAQLFLGTRVQCAQCHSHPFDRWTQDDYYNWMSVFARIDYKVLENRRRDDNDKHEFKGEQIVFIGSKGTVQNARTGQPAKPHFLGANEPPSTQAPDELAALAEWVTRPENPYFARTQANRIWFHLMGRGLVDPIDDFRASNPATNPELLEALARDLVDHGFDLRHLVRVIMNSRTYQISRLPNETNAADEINFSRALVRRLTAEQLLDCQSQVMGVPLQFAGYPLGTRAVQLPGALPEYRGKKTEVDQFLATFGKTPRLLPSECERSNEPTMSQAFQLISGPVLHDLLTDKANRIESLLKSAEKPEHLINELFWSALSRAPHPAELARFTEHLDAAENQRAALEDILWSLVNSKEFIFR